MKQQKNANKVYFPIIFTIIIIFCVCGVFAMATQIIQFFQLSLASIIQEIVLFPGLPRGKSAWESENKNKMSKSNDPVSACLFFTHYF